MDKIDYTVSWNEPSVKERKKQAVEAACFILILN